MGFSSKDKHTYLNQSASKHGFRNMRDSLGLVKVPVEARYGAQTQRAINNFKISGLGLQESFIRSLLNIKKASAMANFKCGVLPREKADCIVWACDDIQANFNKKDFPVDIFQTGSGTSTNMNVNEVLANVANDYARTQLKSNEVIHSNDDVNQSQSSNDVFPSSIHLSCALAINNRLRPALFELTESIEAVILKYGLNVKVGRTHLMDAMPMTVGQELSGWASQIKYANRRLSEVYLRLCELPLGGTAVGTGVNAPKGFSEECVALLSDITQTPLSLKPNFFEAISCQDTAVELSGQLKVLAVSLMKISNDLRWMNSGPYSGLSELKLEMLQPGSSIMPAKVNPVIPEAVAMVCAQVMGNDTSIAVAGQSGNFQLNVMLPLIAHNLLQSIDLLTNACEHLNQKVFKNIQYNVKSLLYSAQKNPILVTALNPILGYEKSAEIAKAAYLSNRPIIDVAKEMSDLPHSRLEELLNPENLV